MKKFLTVLLALVTALCLCFGLAACGDTSETPAGGTQTEQGSSNGDIKPDDGATSPGGDEAPSGGDKQLGEGGDKKPEQGGDEPCAHQYTAENVCSLCGDKWEYTEGLNYTYVEGTDSYAVGDNPDASGDIVIPYGYNGKFVTSIGFYVFYNCDGLTSVVIPDSVTEIGWNAFEDCDGLTSVTIPDSVTEIGERAFEGTAYYEDASHWENGEALYIGNHLIEAKDTISGAYAIRTGTKTIGDRAFFGCIRLSSVTIPDSVTSIGFMAFVGCDGLKNVTIGSGVTSIGGEAFRGCSGLTSVVIPDSVTEIGEYAFFNCSELESVTIGSGSIGSGSIGSRAFYKCSGLMSVTIGSGVTWIGQCAFLGCSGLTSVTIGSGVTEIAVSAFDGCNRLTDIQFKGTVKEWQEIGKWSGWDNGTGDYTVTCTDGTVDKSGNVTHFEN